MLNLQAELLMDYLQAKTKHIYRACASFQVHEQALSAAGLQD